jgi:hypothetical protein
MKTLIGRVLAATALLALAPRGYAQKADPPGPAWSSLQFLIGNWTGGGGGQPGSGEGSFSFEPELNHRILVRHSFNSIKNGPEAGSRHDDLMVVYLDTPGQPPRAIYFDSEGHVIHYALSTPKPNVAIFESDASRPGPRYRLSYALSGKSLDGKFEIAPPGNPEYKTYLTWTTVKDER